MPGSPGGAPPPLQAVVGAALAASSDAARVLAAAPARVRTPARVLAALHDLALAGRAPALAAAHAAGDAPAAARAAVDLLLAQGDEVLAVAARRPVHELLDQPCAVLQPAVAAAAARTGADAVGLIAMSGAPGLDLHLDRVATTHDSGHVLGDPASPVQLRVALRGGRPVPADPLPRVLSRTALGRDPLDLADPADARWLRACLPPDAPERPRLDAALTVAGSAPAQVLRGDPVALLPQALAGVPASALAVLTTTWALSALDREERERLLRALADAAASRPVAWVALEGVGVAPGVPTLGDRAASGHSTIGLTLLHGTSRSVAALARCWSRGRYAEWLVGSG